MTKTSSNQSSQRNLAADVQVTLSDTKNVIPQAFLSDFNRMKHQIFELTSLVEEQMKVSSRLDQTVQRLQEENLKLKSDMKVL